MSAADQTRPGAFDIPGWAVAKFVKPQPRKVVMPANDAREETK